MKIWIIQTGERLPLTSGTRMMRSGLIAFELARRGHQVTWWASAFDHYRRDFVDPALDGTLLVQNLTLRLLRGTGYSANLSLRRFIDHAKVAREFAREAWKSEKPDLIVSAMPDYRIADAAFGYARANGVPFVLDLRDRWPWDFLEHVPVSLRQVARLALSADFAMARRVIAGADSLVTMMETWEDWIATEGGRSRRPGDRVFYLGAERLKRNDALIRQPVRRVLSLAEDRWPILFIGAFTNRSWPREAVEAWRLFSQTGPALPRPLLILAGDGDRRDELERLVAGSADVMLPGYVNDAEIAALLDCAKVGLATLNGDYEAMPNKVFTYLSGGLPMLSSMGGELAAFLEREQVGLTCRTPEAMAAAIGELIGDEPRRMRMAQRAQAIFDDRYDAARLYCAYADHLEAVTRGGR